LHQLAVAYHTYRNVNDGVPPYTERWFGNWAERCYYPQLYEYATDAEVFRCQEAGAEGRWEEPYEFAVRREDVKDRSKLLRNYDMVSYGANNWGWTDIDRQGCLNGDYDDDRSQTNMGDVVNATELILFGDNTMNGQWDATIDPSDSTEYPGNRHLGGRCNIAFVDGHTDRFFQSFLLDRRRAGHLWRRCNERF
jgi:prepilin-type processing-associated H-X9-DG protein